MLIEFHLYLWNFCASEKTHFGTFGGRLGNGEIYNRNAARQTTGNKIRIAQHGSVKVVQIVNMLILARFINARPANRQIDRIVGFQF